MRVWGGVFCTLGVTGLDYFRVKYNLGFDMHVGKMNSVQITLAEKQLYLASDFVLVILVVNQSIASDYSICFLPKVTSLPG